MRTIKRLTAMAMLVAGCFWAMTSMTACNTTEGVGEDIEEAGDEIQDAAD
jgi:predicted small secreted protein